MGVAVLRLPNGLDFSELTPKVVMPDNGMGHLNTANGQGFANELLTAANAASELLHIDSNLNLANMDSASPQNSYTMPQEPPLPNMQRGSRSYKINNSDAASITYHTKGGSEVPQTVLDAMNIFTRKQPKGTIDVFWLYDDGGESTWHTMGKIRFWWMRFLIARSNDFAALHHLDAFALAELQVARVYHVSWQGRGAGGEEVRFAGPHLTGNLTLYIINL